MLVFHIDFNTEALTRDTVLSMLRFAASCGYDAVLWEVEDKIQWECCPECVSQDAFSKEEFREILAEAKALGLMPIPLMQTFGHGEYILSHSEYFKWRELPDKKDCYCVSNPEVRKFLKGFLHEYLELFGEDVRYFHLGGDEAYSFGKCPICSTRNRMELYGEHLREVASELIERNIRPGCWCDMILSGDEHEAVKHIPSEFVIWHWDYRYGTASNSVSKWSNKTDFLKSHGYDVVFCAAAESHGDDPFLPKYRFHEANIAASAALARREEFLGLCVTSWSIRGVSKVAQYPLFELAARCYSDQELDPSQEFKRCVRSFFGDITPDTLYRLSDWDNFYLFEGRSWNVYKDAMPPMVGQFDYILGRNVAHTPGFPEAAIADLSQQLTATQQAIDEVRNASFKLAAADILIEAATLRAALLKTLIDVLKTGRHKGVPFAATVAYYAKEKTDWSAANMARTVWGILDERYAVPFDPTQLFKPR